MQGTNPTEFEKWCAKEMGHTVEYMIMQRKINTLGMLQYRNAEIEKRFMAYKAGLISGASIGCSHAKVQGTNWVKCSDKMPEVGKPVIVKLGTMLHIMHISDFDGQWDDGEFLSGVGLENIKYWHELPPMPEGE
ncbi:DUF551 domain-containing protein [Providencia hangzhouensis]